MIGITAAIHPAAWTVWKDVDANVSQRTYSTGVAEAGAIPLVLPPSEPGTRSPGDLLDLIDAVVLSGGADIDPAAYGESPATETQSTNRERDEFELALAAAALEREMPVLGICRGMQLLNVVRGGTLEQHIEGSERHLHAPGQFVDHEVHLEPGSLAARALDAELVSVRSHHHQGIGRLGSGLVASGWSHPDGVIEAIELPDLRFALGLLWHAEEERQSPVITALAKAARTQAVAA